MERSVSQFLIGDPGCSYSELSSLMVEGDMDDIIGKKLGSIGEQLGINQSSISHVLAYRKDNPADIQHAISKLLQYYRSEKANEATLMSLLTALGKLKLNKTKKSIEHRYRENNKTYRVSKNGRKKLAQESQPATRSSAEETLIKNDNTNVSAQRKRMFGNFNFQCKSIPINVYVLSALIFVVLVAVISLILLTKNANSELTLKTIDQESDEHNSMLSESVVTVSSYAHFDKLFKKNRQCCKALNISMQNSAHWLPGQKLRGGKFLKELTISGPFDVVVLLEILSDAVNLNTLHIDNYDDLFCRQNRYKNISRFIKPINLADLSTLYFDNFTLCTQIYSRLVENVNMYQLSHIHMRNSQLHDMNVDDIRELIQKSHSSLECIVLSFDSKTRQSILNVDFEYPKVRKIMYDIQRHVVDGKKFWPSMRENISDAFLNLEYFESQSGIIYIDLINILKCKRIKSLNVTVYYTVADDPWNIAAAYKGKTLLQVEITLIFTSNCPSSEEIWHFGVETFSDRLTSFKIMSNCIVMQQMDKINGPDDIMYIYSRHRKPS